MTATDEIDGTCLKVPEFWCPLAGGEHPGGEHGGARAVRWMESLHIWGRPEHGQLLAGYEIGRMVALTAPHALDERFQVAVDLNVWYHWADDSFGDAGLDRRSLVNLIDLVVRLGHALMVPDSAAHSDPFAVGLADICTRVAGMATRVQYQEWMAGIMGYLLHELAESAWREGTEVPTLERYAIYCTDGRAAMPSMLLLPILGGYHIPDDQMRRLWPLTRLACLLACVDNDIYSLPKELGQVGHVSFPKLIAHERELGLQQALDAAMASRDVLMTEFLSLGTQLSLELQEPGARFVRDLGAWIRGQLTWGLSSKRFTRAGFRLPTDFVDAPHPVSIVDEQCAARLLATLGK